MNKSRWVIPGIVTAAALVSAVGIIALTRYGASAPSAAEASGSPVLRVDRDRIDLGDIPLGETAEAHFTLSNAGDATLLLARVPYVEAVAGC